MLAAIGISHLLMPTALTLLDYHYLSVMPMACQGRPFVQKDNLSELDQVYK
jgi:hypothetical protein